MAFLLFFPNRKEAAGVDLGHPVLRSHLLQFLQSSLLLAPGTHALSDCWDL